MQGDGGITEQRIKEIEREFHDMGITKEQMIRLLAHTLMYGGLTGEQIDELINDWRYLKDKI